MRSYCEFSLCKCGKIIGGIVDRLAVIVEDAACEEDP